MLAHISNLSIWEAEGGGSQVQVQAGLQREFYSNHSGYRVKLCLEKKVLCTQYNNVEVQVYNR
jgi:hypothetical protein